MPVHGEVAPIPVTIAAIGPEFDDAAAIIVADAMEDGSVALARAALAAARDDLDRAIYGVRAGDDLVGVYILKKISLMNEITHLAVRADHRRRGHGRVCLHDALLRSGRRPLVVNASEANVGFFKACGFKLVGKRTGPDGVVRYRLGWHAPLPRSVTVPPGEERDSSPRSA